MPTALRLGERQHVVLERHGIVLCCGQWIKQQVDRPEPDRLEAALDAGHELRLVEARVRDLGGDEQLRRAATPLRRTASPTPASVS